MKYFSRMIFISLFLCQVSFAHEKVVIIPLVGGSDASASAKPNVIYVDQKTRNTPDVFGFGNVQAAINAAANKASSSKPYEVRIAPGYYQLSATIQLKPYVNVVGSGKNATILTANISGAAISSSSAIISGSSHSSLGNLAIDNHATTGTYTIGIYNLGTVINVHDVDINVEGIHEAIGIFDDNSSSKYENVVTEATGLVNAFGIKTVRSRIILNHVIADGSSIRRGYGMSNRTAPRVIVKNSVLIGSLYALSDTANSVIENTQLIGAVRATSAQCSFIYDEDLDAVSC
ncbi:MAG: glycosyl hydrolase family 28-related protein [Arenicellales bacterium]